MYETIAKVFAENANDVERLIDFDRDVVALMIDSLEQLKKDVPPQAHYFKNKIERAEQVIKSIRNNNSLKSKYDTVCNQAVVLLVSHFSSSVGDLFREAVSKALDRDGNEALFNEELKLTFRDIKDRNWNLKASAGDLLIAKKDLTFQDMQSTRRAFADYVGVEIDKDQCANNIILGQAARHVIVHASSRVGDRMIKQVSKANPRTLKRQLVEDESLVFSKDEVIELKNEMLGFIKKVIVKLDNSA
jgi:hypothetical protein